MAEITVEIKGIDIVRKAILKLDINKIILEAFKKQLEEPELLCPVCCKELEICIGGEWNPPETDNYYYIACRGCSIRSLRFETREELFDLVKSWKKKLDKEQ